MTDRDCVSGRDQQQESQVTEDLGTTAPQSLSVKSDLESMSARDLGAAVTPLFILPGRVQQEALTELVIRCEVADRLLAERKP